MFHFQIVHVEGKKNVVADALSRKPQISAVSIPYYHELDDMKKHYATDEDFAQIFDQLMAGQHNEHYVLKDGFMMMHGRLCVSRPLRQKLMLESHAPPYSGHRGIDATIKVVESLVDQTKSLAIVIRNKETTTRVKDASIRRKEKAKP